MRSAGKAFAGLASLTLFDIAAAGAADLPMKAPMRAPAVAAYDWTGAYIGAHAGYRWADANLTIPERTAGYGLDSGIFGLHAGYNIMFSPSLLAGVEGDWSWGSGKGSAVLGYDVEAFGDNFDGFAFSQVKLRWQATLRGRLGFVNGPWLLYGTGGIAFTEVKWNWRATEGDSGAWSDSDVRTGWVFGGGVEYMYSPAWIARVEYLWENFGDLDVPHDTTSPARSGKLDLDDVHKLRVGISYKFGNWR